MAKEPVKANLFRFVTLRNPQLIEEKEKDPGFVFHPDEKKNIFYSAVNGKTDAEKPAALQAVSDSFNAFKTRTEIKKAYAKLYPFSSWLMQNKNELTFSAIKENSNGVVRFTSTQELKVWDNLIYQTINRTSTYVREACIQLLITNKFLKAFLDFSETVEADHIFTKEEKKAFTRRAHASVVISKVLFSSETISNKKTLTKTTNIQDEAFVRDSKFEAAKLRINDLKSLKKSLKKIDLLYTKENQKIYNQKLKTHNEEVERIINESKAGIVKSTNPESGEILSEYDFLNTKLPKFEYTKEDAINSKYLNSRLSEEEMAIFDGQELEIYDTFQEVYEAIDIQIQEDTQIANNNNPTTSTTVVVDGNPITVGAQTYPTNAYCFRAFFGITANKKNTLFMVLGTGYSNANVTSANYTLTGSLGVTYTDTSVLKISSNNNSVKLNFFPLGVLLLNDTYTFTGTITLNNGVVLTFNVSNIIVARFVSSFQGCCTIKDGTTEEPTDTTNTTPPRTPIYGVTNLGIADFRRVEQEVCCYVAGEVSHIENILAREYKERETRSLNSVETTSEVTREREVENLTDTTTTERNEMQSETASVLNEDQSQSYGASTSVNGNYGKISFGANAYFDGSSSSSSSNSNSQAQTYAQEVTERAMERIVQKTTSKRTTRILKEFEEKNKHGFDNTKGENHITGVYRWVDKIYKNSLINYGKRLMYEFAIPEPARFLKDAIWKKLENNEIESVVILPTAPVHPNQFIFLSEPNLRVKKSNDISGDNYQELASQYNAEVKPKPNDTIIVGKAFSSSTQASDKKNFTEVLSFDEDYELPEGYRTLRAKVSCEVPQEGNLGGMVIVGTKNFGLSGYWTGDVRNFGDIDPYINTVPISYSSVGFHAVNVGVSIECELTAEGLQQWQNETYNAIMTAYYDRLREYNEAIAASEVIPSDEKEKLTYNPLHNRALEKREIKRIALELIIEQDKVSRNNYTGTSLTNVDSNLEFQTHAATVKFFEQAFDWEIMAYIFYPYFYAAETDWKDLFQMQDAADPLFQAFLQSGMARAVVPVRPGFEDAVNWYMETGEIWNGQGLVIDQDDDLYISVAEEMQTVEGVVEGTWETRLPTSLTIVQAESAVLKEGGLPCFCEEHVEDNPINSSTDVIGGDNGVGDSTNP